MLLNNVDYLEGLSRQECNGGIDIVTSNPPYRGFPEGELVFLGLRLPFNIWTRKFVLQIFGMLLTYGDHRVAKFALRPKNEGPEKKLLGTFYPFSKIWLICWPFRWHLHGIYGFTQQLHTFYDFLQCLVHLTSNVLFPWPF